MKRTLASWLYQVLYECRNDFLHGNPVERSNLILATPQRTIFEYAAPLYRIALTAFLPLGVGQPAFYRASKRIGINTFVLCSVCGGSYIMPESSGQVIKTRADLFARIQKWPSLPPSY